MVGPGLLLPASLYPVWGPSELLAHLVLLFLVSYKMKLSSAGPPEDLGRPPGLGDHSSAFLPGPCFTPANRPGAMCGGMGTQLGSVPWQGVSSIQEDETSQSCLLWCRVLCGAASLNI